MNKTQTIVALSAAFILSLPSISVNAGNLAVKQSPTAVAGINCHKLDGKKLCNCKGKKACNKLAANCANKLVGGKDSAGTPYKQCNNVLNIKKLGLTF